MIDYVEVRSWATRDVVGIIDTAKSIIWNTIYYGVGDFQIDVAATPANVAMLAIGNFITRSNDYNCGIIQHVDITDSVDGGKMIVASGPFCKTILSQRIIYKVASNYAITPTIISGNVATAVWSLINSNAGSAAPANRQLPLFARGVVNDLPQIIVDASGNADQRQVDAENLLTYTDALLKEYEIGAYMWLDTSTARFLYVAFQGVDRSRDNTDGNAPLIFSIEMDNLTSASYTIDSTQHKTMCLIGGEELTYNSGAENEYKQRFMAFYGDNVTGYTRKETLIDASAIKKAYKDEDNTEQIYSDAEYNKLLIQNGRQMLGNLIVVEIIDGVIDLTNSGLKYGVDFGIGDKITILDNTLGRYINTRILSVTEVQDDNGYAINIQYGE